MYHEKTCTFTLGILCDSSNLWGWYLWFSSGANWIPRHWDMSRIKVNKKRRAAECRPCKETCKIQKVLDCELIGGDWYPSPGSHSSVRTSLLLNKKGSHTAYWENLHRKNFHRNRAWAGSRNDQESHSWLFTSNNELFSFPSHFLL